MTILEHMGYSTLTILWTDYGSPESPFWNRASGIASRLLRFDKINLQKNPFLVKNIHMKIFYKLISICKHSCQIDQASNHQKRNRQNRQRHS